MERSSKEKDAKSMNMVLPLDLIFEDFRACKTYAEKIKFLNTLRDMPYRFNVDGLIRSWRKVERDEKLAAKLENETE